MAAEADTRPPVSAVAVTAGSSDFATIPARALWVGTSGDATVTFENGVSCVLKSVAAGMWHPMRIRKLTAFTGADAVVGY